MSDTKNISTPITDLARAADSGNEFEDEPLTLRKALVMTALIAAVFGLPVAVGCFFYVAGLPPVVAMFGGACFVVVPLMIGVAVGAIERAWLRRTRGAPPQIDERVEIVHGAYKGRSGIVRSKGQHYPHEIYILLDDSQTGKLTRFTWREMWPVRNS